jgi:hypothetical protein
VINNIGGMPAPVDVDAHFADGTSQVVHETAAIWASDQRRATVSLQTNKTLQSLELRGGIWMDADSSNNSWSGAVGSRVTR